MKLNILPQRIRRALRLYDPLEELLVDASSVETPQACCSALSDRLVRRYEAEFRAIARASRADSIRLRQMASEALIAGDAMRRRKPPPSTGKAT